MSVANAIESRRSCHLFDPEQALDDAVIARLATLASRAPSAYNCQNWRFIAVRSASGKAALAAAAYGQRKVSDAAVTFIICGTLPPQHGLAAALQPAVLRGDVSAALAASWVSQASDTFHDQPQLQREEAIRSASLAAMTLLLAAEGEGLASCPLSGFDAAAVRQAFALPPEQLPVLLVSIGHAASGNAPQKPRKALSELLQLA
ncbi:nitroreductase family protein [Chitinilyticum litopenaei]|uniref:nitroreductase family protein n=1 Tax=Chitinilyticum litopenaei TaxID=1121276 RepID=UPI00040763F0|nr:nitroreductase family protein [Chitinilyticum litopenaei]